jgi:hypothetical protein
VIGTCPNTGVCSTAAHEAMKADESVWSQLPVPPKGGIQRMDYGDGEVEVFELRNCHCTSTLYKAVTP